MSDSPHNHSDGSHVDPYHGEYQGLLHRTSRLNMDNPVDIKKAISEFEQFIDKKVHRSRSVFYANKNIEKFRKYLMIVEQRNCLAETDTTCTPLIPSAGDPLRALCYLEGYIERIMHEQGLEVEQSVRDRFEILHQHIDASAITMVNNPMSLKDIEGFIETYTGSEIK